MQFSSSYSFSDADMFLMMKQTFGPMFVVLWIVSLAVCVVNFVGMWKVFVKSGRAGWKCLIPFYNLYCQFDMMYGNGWKFLLLLIPFYNIYVAIKFYFDFAKAFGQGTAFGFGLLFLTPIFVCILAFGDYRYVGQYPGNDVARPGSASHRPTIMRSGGSFEA